MCFVHMHKCDGQCIQARMQKQAWANEQHKYQNQIRPREKTTVVYGKVASDFTLTDFPTKMFPSVQYLFVSATDIALRNTLLLCTNETKLLCPFKVNFLTAFGFVLNPINHWIN